MTASVGIDVYAKDRASDTFHRVGASATSSGESFHRMGLMAKAAGLAVIGAAVATTRVLIDSGKAAVEDESAQRKLALGLQNGADATDKQIAAAERWITAQGKAFGVADDELRPALQKLAQSTGDVGKAQAQLRLAMDVSAGSGKSLTAVTEAMMKANNGSVGGLSRLGIATKDAAGKTLSLDAITKNMANTFGGQAASQADTMAGKTAKLSVLFNETKEAIGYKLIPVVLQLADFFTAKVVPAISLVYGMLKDKFGPTISEIGGWIKGTMIPALQTFVGQMKSGEGAGGQFAAAFGKVSDVLGKVAHFIGDNKTAVATFVGIIGTVITAVKIWTATQAALNFVMSANPIGLVVIAIAALAAGAVMAYRKSETFKEIVDGAFRLVAKTGTWMWENALKPAFEAMKKGFTALGEAGTWLWNNALQPAFKFIVSGVASILDMWGKMLDSLSNVPGFGWAKGAADAMGKAATQARSMADGINKIPPRKDVSIVTHYTQTGVKPGGGMNGGADGLLDPHPRINARGSGGYGPTRDLADGMDRAQGHMRRTLEQIRNDVSKTRDRFQSLLAEKAQFVGGFSSFSGSVFGQGAEDGTPQTAGAMINYQAGQAANAKQLAADVKSLVSRGLSQSLIKQLAASGESGMAQIRALAMGSSADIEQLNSLNAQTAASLQEAGLAAGGALFDNKINAAKDDLQASQAALAQKVADAVGNSHTRVEVTVNVGAKQVIQAVKAYNKDRGKASNSFD